MSNCEDRSHFRDPEETVWIDDTGEVPAPRDTVLSIANVAKMFGVSRFALRLYERLGLIKRRHRVGRVQVYGWADCDRLALIIKGRKAGLSISELTTVLKAADTECTPEAAKAGRDKCLELIDRLDRRRHELRDALAELRQLYTLISTKGPDR